MGFEAFKIGVNLTLTGDANAALQKFRLTVIQASEAVDVLTTRTKVLKGELLTLGGVLRKLNPSLNRFASELNLAATGFKSTNTSMTGFNSRLTSSNIKVEALSRNTAILKGELAGLAIAGDSAAASMGAMPFARRKGGVGGSENTERLEGAAAGASALRMHPRTKEFGPVGIGFSPGYVGAAVGAYVEYKSYEQAKTYMQAQAEFAQLNLGEKANKEADDYAKNLKLVGVSQIDALKTLRDSVVVMGDLASGEKVAPIISKMQYANNALGSSAGIRIGESQYQDLLRVVEIRGGFKSPEEMQKQINEMQQVMSGTGFRVLPNQYLNLMKTGGVAAQQLSDEALYFGLEPLIQEIGGNRVGTALMSMYQAVNAGKMTTQSAIRFQELGLVEPDKAVYNKIGMIKRIKPGGMVGHELARKDFQKWIQDYYLPALKAHGITSQEDVLNEVAYDFGNRTAANIVSKAILQEEKIKKNMRISMGSKGNVATYKAAQETPAGKEIALAKAASDLGVALGQLTMPAVLSGLTALTALVRGITYVVNALNSIKFLVTPADIEKVKNKPTESPFKNLFFHGNDKKDEKQTITVKPIMSQTIQVKSQITLDKKIVGEAVTTHIIDKANSIPNNTSRFDTGMSPTPVLMKMGNY